jgi:hypothetical protein
MDKMVGEEDIRKKDNGKIRKKGNELTVKGTVSRDFCICFFFMNQFPPSP